MKETSTGRGTVRVRVTAASLLVTTVVLVLAGFALVAAQRHQLVANIDDQLDQRARDTIALIADSPIEQALTRIPESDLRVQVINGRGSVIAASRSLAGYPALSKPVPLHRDVIRDLRLTGDPHPFRMLSRPVPAGRAGMTGARAVNVIIDLDDVNDGVRALTTSLFIAVPCLVVVLGILVWLVVGRALRPVEAIRAEVALIGDRELHRRVPSPAGEDEIARLATTMNAMLARVESAVRRQREFVGDASHELRTPLARMRTDLEVDVAHPEQADLGQTHRRLLGEVIALQHLVGDLLLLARTDDAIDPLPAAEVDLDDIVHRVISQVRAESDVPFDLNGVSAAQVIGDAPQLARVVDNLARNAARHATTRVAISLGETDGLALLAIVDDGPGVPPDQVHRVFERFSRVDNGRTAADGGSGLGLAIVRDIVARHGGTVVVDQAHTPGARFVVTLPLAPANLNDSAGTLE